MGKINFLSQSTSLILVITVSLIFVFIGLVYSKNYQGLNNYLTANRSVGFFSLSTSLIASALGAWILFGPASAATWGGIGAVIGYSLGTAFPMIALIYLGKKIRKVFPKGTTLIGVYYGLNKITKLVPVGIFFRGSSILLAVLAIYFAYEGIHELSEGLEELASLHFPILIS